jgi:endo-1,3(4)-beta-glucanase
MIVFRVLTLLITISIVTSVDVLLPLSTSTPNSSFYPNIVHPRQPQRLSLSNKRALHTNKFYTNPLLGTGENPILTHPFVLLMNAGAPYGVSVSCTEQLSFGPQIDSTRVKYFINVILKNLQVSATEFTAKNFEMIDADDPGFALTLRMRQQGSQASITMPIVRGMAYVTFEYNSATPRISTAHAILTVNGQASGRISAKRFEIVLNNGQTWILYTLNGDITLELRDNALFGTQAITNVLRVTKKQSDSYANTLLDSHVSVYPTGCQLRADVTDSKGTYTFLWQRKGDLTNTLLHYTFAHHRQSMATSSATSTSVLAQSASKGPMYGYLGNVWILNENSLSTMGFLAPRAPAPQYEDNIVAQLRKDITDGVNLGVSDYYFTGKAFHKYALLCLLADYYREAPLREKCIKTLESGFDVLITGKNPNALRYDTTWFGLVSAAGLAPSQELADFGNSYYNDHHYHWGYFIQTAALIAQLDPSYIPKMKTWVDNLIRDANNPSTDDKNFPQFRYFDWYSGHSWSQGLFESADGKDQESTSEEINYHYGVALWGLATKSSTLESLGRLMLAIAKRAIQTYFLMDSDNKVMPKEFIANKVTGIFFENKADYATWFGANPEFIHGIQMLPSTPITEEVRLPKFVEEEWNTIVGKVLAGAVAGWKSVLYTNYAIINRGEAFRQLLTAPLDDGLTRTWALYWAATRPNTNDGTGTLPTPTTSNPSSSTSGGTTSGPPVTGGECTMPVGSPCTSLTAPGDAAAGLGMYYDPTCAQGGVGCDHIKANCRLCAKNPAVADNPFRKCPACV